MLLDLFNLEKYPAGAPKAFAAADTDAAAPLVVAEVAIRARRTCPAAHEAPSITERSRLDGITVDQLDSRFQVPQFAPGDDRAGLHSRDVSLQRPAGA